MLPEVRMYLAEVRSLMHLDARTEREVLEELRSYFDEKVAELHQGGRSPSEAARLAIESCGRPREIAQRMYEAHSKGSLTEAGLAALPHLAVAGLFVWNMWSSPVIAIGVFMVIPLVTIWGWWHGKPSWMYAWIGYSFCPLLVAGYVSKGVLGDGWRFLLGSGSMPDLAVFVPVAVGALGCLGLISAVTARVARRDWVLASLMLVPLPVVAGWFASIDRVDLLSGGTGDIHRLDGAMSLSLVALAVTSAAFVLVRQRVVKVGGIAAVGTLAGVTVAHNLWGEKGLLGLLAIALLLVFFLLSPALLEEAGEEEARRVASTLS